MEQKRKKEKTNGQRTRQRATRGIGCEINYNKQQQPCTTVQILYNINDNKSCEIKILQNAYS